MDFPDAMQQFAKTALAHLAENFYRIFIEGRRNQMHHAYDCPILLEARLREQLTAPIQLKMTELEALFIIAHLEQHAYDCPVAVEARRRDQSLLLNTPTMSESEARFNTSHVENGTTLHSQNCLPEVLATIRLLEAVIKDNNDRETAMAWSQRQETRPPEQERKRTWKDCFQTTSSVENETIIKVKK
jgi:hypothetical protein